MDICDIYKCRDIRDIHYVFMGGATFTSVVTFVTFKCGATFTSVVTFIMYS